MTRCKECNCDVEGLRSKIWEDRPRPYGMSEAERSYRMGQYDGQYDVIGLVRSYLPEPPEIVEGLTMQQALEGLRHGVYLRAMPPARPWVVLDCGGFVFEDNGYAAWEPDTTDLGPWRAEVAGHGSHDAESL